MIKTVVVDSFKAVPYLEGSLLMAANAKKIVFSESRPNVVGAG